MDYFDLIMCAVDYIEDHLKQDISQDDVANHVGFSVYHFHRIFQMAVKDSMTGYIRERRLTHAAYDLLQSSRTIMDVAVEYHFDSHESFSRAFKRMFGVTPSAFRQSPDAYQTLLRVSQRQRMDESTIRHLMGGITSEPSFVYREEMTLVGLAAHSTDGVDFGALGQAFQGRKHELPERIHPTVSYGLIAWTGVNVEFDYVAGAQVSACGCVPEGMTIKTVPSNHYAVFTHRGPFETMDSSWFYVMGIWLPKSKVRRAQGYAFELYDGARCAGMPPHEIEVDIYVPVVL